MQLTEVTMVSSEEIDDAAARLTEHLSTARVGVRILLAGAIGACLQLRAAALAAGVEDDEIHIQATESGPIHVYCAHCAASTKTTAGIDSLVVCSGCAKTLIVYHHVSRRLGKYLGFQVDAETVSQA
ncbi:dimethylamine monooxygenase subunit DmmA family protein [Mycolicibacterium vaccae]|uniref:dimethylamine monooxygenase subunit DmmA family protein n=1 Tax=Mycolicibacterium vaccae TaxID=1810 RepID=UPI003CEF5436